MTSYWFYVIVFFMNSELLKQEFSLIPESQLSIPERDALWSTAIKARIAADIEIRNHWEEMLPEQRETNLSKVQTGENAQSKRYSAYIDLPALVISNMVEKRTLPAIAKNEDSVSVAVLGMFEAMRSWNSRGNLNFCTYATGVIRKSVIDYFADNSAYSGLSKADHQNRAIYEATSGDMEEDEVFERLVFGSNEQIAVSPKGCSPDTANCYTPDKYLEILSSFGENAKASLPDDMSLGDYLDGLIEADRVLNGKRASLNFVEDTSNEDAVTRIALREAVSKALGQLDQRSQDIIRTRFGLDDGKVKTLHETAKIIGHGRITVERVRQLEYKAFAMLRCPRYSRQFKNL